MTMATTTTKTTSCLLYGAVASVMFASMVVGEVVTIPPNGTDDRINCSLVASQDYGTQLAALLSGPRVKLIEMDIELIDHPPGELKKWLKGVHKPYRWVRSTGSEGQGLLMLEENYSLMSLTALSIGVTRMSFNITEHPHACLKALPSNEIMLALRKAFFADFKIDEESGIQSSQFSLGPDEAICNMRVVNDDGYAAFRYQCCKEMQGSVVCKDVEKNGWIEVLLVLILVSKVLIFLYSPLFLPESLYRLKYVACQYIHRLPDEAELPLNIVVTEHSHLYENDRPDRTVRLFELSQMEYFKTLVSSSRWRLDTVYEVKLKDVRLSVKARYLLERCKVPVGVLKTTYKYLCLCKIRKLEALKFCCDSSILGRFTPTGVRMMRWSQCMSLFAQFCQLVIVVSPWVVRLIVYWLFEYDMIQERHTSAESVDLPISNTGSLVKYLTPVHGIFIFIYAVIAIDSLIYGVITKSLREKLKVVLRQCMRDMRERSRMAVCSSVVKLTVVPFAVFGLVGFIIFPFYLVVIAFITLPVIACYVFPTINLTIRLLIHLLIFICPQSMSVRFDRWSDQLTGLKQQLFVGEVTAREHFVKRTHHNSSKGVVLQLQLFTIFLCLLSLWSATLLLTEIVMFLVEVLCYTFMGVVVNAGITLQYCTVIVLVVWHGKSACARVHDVYLQYHKMIHDLIVDMKKNEIDAVARLSACDQQNTAFRVVGDKSSMAPRLDGPVLRVKGKVPQWLTPGMLAFLNRHDCSFTPEKFFVNTISLDFHSCPGPVYRKVLSALWDFAKIVLFLFFVLVIVLAFGDAYRISSTNQLLATVVGGFVPFFFSHFFTSKADTSGFDKDSAHFMTEFHAAINRFEQAWPVYDIIPASFREVGSSGNNGSSSSSSGRSDNGGKDSSKYREKTTTQFEETSFVVVDSDPKKKNPEHSQNLSKSLNPEPTQRLINNSPILPVHPPSVKVKSDHLDNITNDNSTTILKAISECESTANIDTRSRTGDQRDKKGVPDSGITTSGRQGRGDNGKDSPLCIAIDIDNSNTKDELTKIGTQMNSDSNHNNNNNNNNNVKHSISLPLPHPSSSYRFLGETFDDEVKNIKIDLIVDISTSKSKSTKKKMDFRRKNNMASGSTSMLDFSHEEFRTRRPIYTPSVSHYGENLV